jgi:hypothetical protein
MLDAGGVAGCVPVAVAQRHSHMSCAVFELPKGEPVFDEYVASFGLTDRLSFHGGDFFKDELPRADVIVLGLNLHGWGAEEKTLLLKKAYSALPEGERSSSTTPSSTTRPGPISSVSWPA